MPKTDPRSVRSVQRVAQIRHQRTPAVRYLRAKTASATTPLEERLWPFQRADVQAMKHMRTFINANHMGMGKTVESIVFSDSIGAKRVLVVCNNRLRYHWEESIAEWNPDPEWHIVSYPTIRKCARNRSDTPPELLPPFDLIIFDEAHKLKNRQTQQTKGAFELTSGTPYLALLTGTPIRNDISELWSQLHIVDPFVFRNYYEFLDAFAEMDDDRRIVGIRNKEQLQRLLNHYMLRRRKEDVMPQLPTYTYKQVRVPMLPAQNRMYLDLEEDLFAAVSHDADQSQPQPQPDEIVVSKTTLSNLTRLMQVCSSPQVLSKEPINPGKGESAKTAAILDIVQDLDSDCQVVIFTVYRKHAQILAAACNEAGISALSIHGGSRENPIPEFRAGKAKVLVGTIALLAEGHNLDNAQVGIFAAKSWVPADNEQAAARLLRGTTTGSPTILDIRCIRPYSSARTVEQHQDGRLYNKTRSVGQVVGPSEIVKAMLQHRQEKT